MNLNMMCVEELEKLLKAKELEKKQLNETIKAIKNELKIAQE